MSAPSEVESQTITSHFILLFTGPILSEGKLWMNPDGRGVQTLKEVPVTAWSDWDNIEPVRIGGKVIDSENGDFKQFSFNVFERKLVILDKMSSTTCATPTSTARWNT